MSNEERIRQALIMIINYGGTDGAHHKAWVLDQVVRILTQDNYENVVRNAGDGPETYDWDEGIAP